MDTQTLKYNIDGLICAIAQDYESGEVLMQAYMNKEALDLTLQTGIAHYYSRSRQKLWKKGETSGHFQKLISISADCDGDCVLMQVQQTGAACHTGEYTCFHNSLKVFDEKAGAYMLPKLMRTINGRKENPVEGSYTAYLFEKGTEKIAKKTGEEAVELVIAAMKKDAEETVLECADLLYHMCVLLSDAKVELSDVFTELKKREG